MLKGGLTLAEIDEFDDVQMLAWSVAFGLAEGSEYDWDKMRWRARS